jgi:hypothetical protein
VAHTSSENPRDLNPAIVKKYKRALLERPGLMPQSVVLIVGQHTTVATFDLERDVYNHKKAENDPDGVADGQHINAAIFSLYDADPKQWSNYTTIPCHVVIGVDALGARKVSLLACFV